MPGTRPGMTRGDARSPSSAQHDRHLLSAAPDGDAPDPALLGGGALEIAGLADLLIVDGEHDVAFLKAEALGRRSVGSFDHDHALDRRIESQLIRQRRRDVRY